MSFKKELVKNILFKAVNVGLSFIVTVLIVRLLGAEGNGVYSLFVANSAIIVLVGGFSFNSGLTYYAAAGKFSNAALLNTLVFVGILQFALIFLCEKIFFGLSGISLFGDIGWSAISLWGAGYVFALLINSYTAAIFSGNKWFDAVNVLAVVANIVFIIVFALMLFPGKGYTFANTIGTVKTYIVLIALQALVSLAYLALKIRYPAGFSFLKAADLKLVTGYAGVAFFANLFQFLAYRMDYWFINFYRGKEDLGLYALAAKLSQVLWLVPITIASVVIPFTVSDGEQLRYKMRAILRLVFSAYLILAIILFFLSPVLIPLFFGNGFAGTVRPFLILLPGVVVFSLTTILAAYFAGINRQEINFVISFICFLVILAGDFMLVPRLGKEGAAIASAVGYAVSGLSSLYVFSRQTRSNVGQLLFLGKNDLAEIKNQVFNKFWGK